MKIQIFEQLVTKSAPRRDLYERFYDTLIELGSGLRAQMAARPAVEGDAGIRAHQINPSLRRRCSPRSIPLRTLPVKVWGRSSTTLTRVGRLYAASRSAHAACTAAAAASTDTPGAGTTWATTVSPVSGSGAPTTAT